MIASLDGLLRLRTLRVFVAAVTSKRGLRAYYERGLAKDLYHRRMLQGADPLVSRSAQPNWHYPSEISALKHRLGVPQLDSDALVQSLTNASFFERMDVSEDAKLAQPSREDGVHFSNDQSKDNSLAVEKGINTMERLTLAFVRCYWPLAPEEYVCAVASRLLSDEWMAELANSLSLNHLVRTGEFPPSQETLSDAIYALLGILDVEHAQHFVIRFIMPRIVELELEDVMPFRYPLPILTDYLNQNVKVHVEPRLLHSTGASTAMSCYVVGIYADQKLVAESPGEKVCIAVDLAAQRALLDLWGVSNHKRVFPFKNISIFSDVFKKHAVDQNHSISDVCGESIDLSLLSQKELSVDPMNVMEEANRYISTVKRQVGTPYRKRLLHRFSRGSLAANSRRALVKPIPSKI